MIRVFDCNCKLKNIEMEKRIAKMEKELEVHNWWQARADMERYVFETIKKREFVGEFVALVNSLQLKK